jgi:hypothetical protein
MFCSCALQISQSSEICKCLELFQIAFLILRYSTTIEAPQIVEMFPAYYIFNALLSTLLILHVVWTYFILKIVYKGIYSGKVR